MPMSRFVVVVAVVGAATAGGCSSTTVQAPIPTADGGGGDGAGDVVDGGSGADAPGGAACTAPGGNCRGNTNACCNGSTCVFDTKDPSKAVCASTCLQDTQCTSGCCKVLIEGSEAVCAPATYCAGSCATPGGDCSKQSGQPCCANAVCVVSTVTGTSCAARCATNDQCRSGCCAPLDNTGALVCSPKQFCP
jgi:hypothetical protein